MRLKRKLWISLLAVPFLAIGADTLYWQFAEHSLDSHFAAWLAERRMSGWTATTGQPMRGGWPFAATLTVPRILLEGSGPDVPGGVSWGAERLILRVSLLRPRVLEIAAAGKQRLRLAGGPTLPYTAEQFTATLPVQSDTPPRWATLSASGLRVSVPSGGNATAELTIGQLQLHCELMPGAAAGAPALVFSANGESVDPPPSLAHVLGPTITHVSIEGALDGPLPGTRPTADRAAAWRDGGGTLDIRRLNLNWGPLDLSATITLALDDELQPMGAGSAHIVGYAETLDALAARGVLSKSAATAAKAVLSLLAHSPEDGSPPDVDVPLTLQYRTLAMRQVPLLRLPELDWP